MSADEDCETSTPWRTGFQIGVACYYFGLGHSLPVELSGSPCGEVFGDKLDFEIIDRIDVREDDPENVGRNAFDRRSHGGYGYRFLVEVVQ